MIVKNTKFDKVILLKPNYYNDDRGYFTESFNKLKLKEFDVNVDFVQDNESFSIKGCLRGLHFQKEPFAQDKLIRVLSGEIFDVVVDLRAGSCTFGEWEGFTLTEENKLQLFVPKGFAHGFCTLSDKTKVLYKCSNYYYPESDSGIIWNDKDLNIDWPIEEPLLSIKDSDLQTFKSFLENMNG